LHWSIKPEAEAIEAGFDSLEEPFSYTASVVDFSESGLRADDLQSNGEVLFDNYAGRRWITDPQVKLYYRAEG
jgi:hypothetical protein